MSDLSLLYLFIFLMVSHLFASIVYAFGTRPIRAAVKRAFERSSPTQTPTPSQPNSPRP